MVLEIYFYAINNPNINGLKQLTYLMISYVSTLGNICLGNFLFHVALTKVTFWHSSSSRASLEGPRWFHSCIWLFGWGGWKAEIHWDSVTLWLWDSEWNVYTWHILKRSQGSQISCKVVQSFCSKDSNSMSGWKHLHVEAYLINPRTSISAHSIIGQATYSGKPRFKGRGWDLTS